jgi:hypothetical protein
MRVYILLRPCLFGVANKGVVTERRNKKAIKEFAEKLWYNCYNASGVSENAVGLTSQITAQRRLGLKSR